LLAVGSAGAIRWCLPPMVGVGAMAMAQTGSTTATSIARRVVVDSITRGDPQGGPGIGEAPTLLAMHDGGLRAPILRSHLGRFETEFRRCR
jgi:hypothetical protein